MSDKKGATPYFLFSLSPHPKSHNLAVPPEPGFGEYGYACSFDYGNIVYRLAAGGIASAGMASMCTGLSSWIRNSLTSVRIQAIVALGVFTLVTRYRKQGSSLITVIRRDGGIYYIVTFGMG